MLHLLGNLLCPAGRRGRLTILTWHRVLPTPDPLLPGEPDAATFTRQMAFIAREFNVLRLSEACERLRSDSLPARAVCLTFDDGYANNETVALPILRRLGLPATFFVAAGFLDGKTMFNDDVVEIIRGAPAGQHDLTALGLPSITITDDASRRTAIDTLLGRLKYRLLDERERLVAHLAEALTSTRATALMMRPEQVRHLADEGMEIGGHTVSHPILARLGRQAARNEIAGGKHALEAITSRPVTLFAYPNGKPDVDYTPEHVRLVREAGFAAAMSTVNGAAHRGSDMYQLPRSNPWERDPRRLAARLLVQCMQPVAA